MSSTLNGFLVTAIAAIGILPAGAAPSDVPAAAVLAKPNCGRTCLEGIMRSYLDHLATHSPGGLPLASPLIARENAKDVPLGEGVWKTISKIRSGETAADPVTGEVASFGAVDIPDGVGALFVRLKVVNRKITESEIIFNGVNNNFSHPENLLHPDIVYDAPVPLNRRSPRAEMLKIVDGYLEGISNHDGSKVRFNYRCDRYASGAKVTNSPDHPADREGGTCAGSFDHLTGQLVVNRRFPVIDVERGLVVALFIIPHHERPQPGTTNVGEWFKIVDGQIRSIEEFSFGGTWPPDSGFESDVETGTPDTPRAMNMHPSQEFLRQALGGTPPVMSIDNAMTDTHGPKLSVQSSTLDNAGFFPVRNTGWGESVSPEVSWSGAPSNTQSYTLIMEDGTAGQGGHGVLHWLAFNIPPATTELPEGLPSVPNGMIMGNNQGGEAAYTGPHSPAGGPVFHYHIQVYALDRTLSLPEGASREAVLRAMQGHILGKGELIASFQGPVI